MKTLPNLGPVGEALRDKIKEQKKKLTPEELQSLAEKGYVPRGTGFVNKATNKFVSNKEIDTALGDRSKPATRVAPAATGDPVYDIVKSIEGSVNEFVELIIEQGKDADALKVEEDTKEKDKPKPPKLGELDIFKKFKALAGIATVFLLQFAYPLYLKAKEMWEQTKIWVDKAKLIFEEKVLSFFTVDIPRYVEDIKDFFVVKVPSYFAQFTDAISVGIQNIMDVPREVLYAMEGFSLKFGRDVIDSVSPWISKIGIDLDDYNEELKKREKKVNEKKAALDAEQAKREKEYKQKTEERQTGRLAYDAEKEAARQLEDRKRQEEFDRRRKELEDRQRTVDNRRAPANVPQQPAQPAKPAPNQNQRGSGDEGMKYPPPSGKHGTITSPFGYRISPAGEKKGQRQFHPGIDVAGVPRGSPIHTLAEGKVIKAGPVGSYGNMVDLQVGSRVYRFAHMDEIFVKAGDIVPKDGVIGTLGNTGVGTGAHLHFEDRDKSSFMDGSTATQDPLKSQAYSLIAVGNKAYKKPTDATAAAPMGGMTDGGAHPTTAAAEKKGTPDSSPGRGAFSSVDQFVSALYGPAKKAADKLDIPVLGLLGQWALESGWGRSVSGDYNYFGIKSFGKPPEKLVTTKEQGLSAAAIQRYKEKGWFIEQRGNVSIVKDAFKSYSSVEDGVAGAIKFLLENKNYSKAGVFGTKTPLDYGLALKRAGYATATNYAQTIADMAKSVKSRLSPAVIAAAEADSGKQVATATQNANVKPAPQQQAAASAPTAKPQRVATSESGGRTSSPNSDSVNRQYKDYFSLPA